MLCALFVGPEATTKELEEKLRELFASHGVRSEHLLDGSRIVLVEQQPAAMEQAVTAARCALALRLLLKSAPIVVCTGRAVVDGKLPVGDLIERGASMLAEAAPSVVRVDEASAGLLDARFEIRGQVGQHTLERERIGGEAPRTLLGQVTPFVGRDRELGQLELIFRESVEEGIARAVLVTAPAGGGKSRLRYELLQRLRSTGEPFELLDRARRRHAHGHAVQRARAGAAGAGPRSRAAIRSSSSSRSYGAASRVSCPKSA